MALVGRTIEITPDLIRAAVEAWHNEESCPAAATGTYSDSDKPYVKCAIESKARNRPVHFPVDSSPLHVLQHCCGDYATCTVWVAQFEEPDLLERTLAANVQAEADQQTQRQIAGDLLKRAFEGSAKSLVLGALAAQPASGKDLAEIRSLLDELEKRRGKK